jgi:hypothetical protein
MVAGGGYLDRSSGWSICSDQACHAEVEITQAQEIFAILVDPPSLFSTH